MPGAVIRYFSAMTNIAAYSPHPRRPHGLRVRCVVVVVVVAVVVCVLCDAAIGAIPTATAPAWRRPAGSSCG